MTRRLSRGSIEHTAAGCPHRPEEVLTAVAFNLRGRVASHAAPVDSFEQFVRARDLPPVEPSLRHQIHRHGGGWVAVVVLMDPQGRIVARVDARATTKMAAAVQLGFQLGMPMDWVRP